MNTVKKTIPKHLNVSTDKLNELIIESIKEIKGESISLLDMRKVEGAPANYFIICEGASTTQVQAISSNIHKEVKKEIGLFPSNYEGYRLGHWILLDYFSTVVHVFYPEKRQHYRLESLWSDAKITEYKDFE